jgi:hypothetical protein
MNENSVSRGCSPSVAEPARSPHGRHLACADVPHPPKLPLLLRTLAVLPILPRECSRLTDDNENAGPPFLHGVASGDPLEDRVVLWTRVTGDSGAPERVVVSWSVATDAKFEHVVASGVTATDADFDFTAKADAHGLRAGTTSTRISGTATRRLERACSTS